MCRRSLQEPTLSEEVSTAGLILIVVVSVPTQIHEAYDNHPDFTVPGGAEPIYKSQMELLETTYLPLAGIRTDLPNLEEARGISRALGLYPDALVITETTTAIHIPSDDGFFIGLVLPRDALNPPSFHDGAERIVLNPGSQFREEQRTHARLVFTNLEFITPSHFWELRCR